MKSFLFTASFAALVWVTATCSAVQGASLDVTPSARRGMTVQHQLCACRHKRYRHAARTQTPVSYADWAYFDPCCRPTGHPRPKGFCGGRDFYLGGVW